MPLVSFFGTTIGGGTDGQSCDGTQGYGCGVAFKLTKAGMSEDIILAQIKSMSLAPLTTDQIIYLGSVGVSQNVIRALIQAGNSGASSNRSQTATMVES